MSLLLRNPNLYYGMGRRRRVRRAQGGGFMDMLRSAHDWIKKNKIISTVGSALGKVGVPYAGAIGTAAGTLGYGRRRMVRRRRRGGALNLRGLLTSAHGLAKKHSLVSRALGHLGHPKLASIAQSAGYGRRRVRRRRRGGAVNLRGLLSSAHGLVKKHQLASKLLGHLGHPKLASAASSLGYGRRRTVRRRTVRRRVVRRRRGGANFFSTDQIAMPRF
jgi:hypothetical protein